MAKKTAKSTRGDRHLRVGEEVRHALAAMIQRGDIHNFQSYGIPVTVTEVRVSSDLRHAIVYVIPLGGKRQADILLSLRQPDVIREFRMALAGAVKLQFVPNLRFELDTSFDQAEKIARLLADDERKRKSMADSQ